MTARYDSYKYLWPPRPEEDHRIEPRRLNEKVGTLWVEAKLNGTSNVMAFDPGRNIKAMSRHGPQAPHKAWQPDAFTRAAFLDLPGKGWYVVGCELMHSKVSGLRNINYIDELLVADGEYLVGTTYAERRAILESLFPNRVRHVSGMYDVIDDHTWLARTYSKDFENLFNTWTQRPECEGLVLKDPNAKLQYCLRETSNVKWLWKSRREHKSYSY